MEDSAWKKLWKWASDTLAGGLVLTAVGIPVMGAGWNIAKNMRSPLDWGNETVTTASVQSISMMFLLVGGLAAYAGACFMIVHVGERLPWWLALLPRIPLAVVVAVGLLSGIIGGIGTPASLLTALWCVARGAY